MNRILPFMGGGENFISIFAALQLGLTALLASYISPVHALDIPTSKAAVSTTVSINAACTTLTPFYWEIGDKTNVVLHSGTGGTGTPAAPARDAEIPIYSAGKWLWGAYVYQRQNGVLNDVDTKYLNFTSGYDAGTLNGLACTGALNVGICRSLMPGLSPDAVDKYAYGPGHFQNQAVNSFNMGTLTAAGLATTVIAGLGGGFSMTYGAPQIAGGAQVSVQEYAKFLRKILNRELLVSYALGTQTACTFTDPSAITGTYPYKYQNNSEVLIDVARTKCGAALYSPVDDPAVGVREAWHYSLGHWVEDDPDPTIGDGAFSSPGAGGFYPWIDSSRTYYGVLARKKFETKSAGDSLKCGRKIRRAWLTGVAQSQ